MKPGQRIEYRKLKFACFRCDNLKRRLAQYGGVVTRRGEHFRYLGASLSGSTLSYYYECNRCGAEFKHERATK